MKLGPTDPKGFPTLTPSLHLTDEIKTKLGATSAKPIEMDGGFQITELRTKEHGRVRIKHLP